MRPRLLVTATLALLGCSDAASDHKTADPELALLGGDTTIFDDGDESFAYPARNLSDERRSLFQLGDGIFNRNWVMAPASPEGADGLGPTFDGRSCSACHADNGRGTPPQEKDELFLGLLVRMSVPGKDDHGAPKPDPTYGDQLNQFGIFGVPGEGTPRVTYVEQAGKYADGTKYSLRVPTYEIEDLQFGPLAADVMMGARIAPQTIGLGLLEAVSEATIMKFAAKNGGHPNHVWDRKKQATVIGRFGWKANQPTVEQQVFAAARNDIGITSTLYPAEDCPAPQTECAAAPASKNQPELAPLQADSLVSHAMTHAVPARRDLDDPIAQRGEEVFGELDCASCHIPEMKTGTLKDWPELSNQTIRPFTDMLLHDMGPELADGRPDYEATGAQWRTPPLWGLGLVESINDGLFLMHDGRARGFAEAILWHGGDAKKSKEAFRKADEADREALVEFLSTL